MDQTYVPPPQMPAPQSPQSNSPLPQQVSIDHLNKTPVSANSPQSTNLPTLPQTSPPTAAPDTAPSAADIPPPSPGAALESIIPQEPPPMSGQSVFDQPQPKANIYTTSSTNVFVKNFLAGMAHALGSIFIYLIFLAIGSYVSYRLFWPQLKPYLDSFQQLATMSTQMQNPNNLDPESIQQLINQSQNQLNQDN